MRKLPLLAAAAAAAVIPALFLAAPSAVTAMHYHDGPAVLTAARTSHIPSVYVGEGVQYQNVGNGLYLHAHCNNCAMSDQAGGVQTWTFYDAQKWNSNHDGSVYTVKVRLVSTSWCATYDQPSGDIYLRDCESTPFGNGDQMFYIPHDYAQGGDWLINSDCSAHTSDHSYCYSEDSQNHIIDIFGNGNAFSEWTPFCVLDC